MHRVIQWEYRYSLDDKLRREAFKLTSTLLLESFPKQVNGLSLRGSWDQCARFIQHVQVLASFYDKFRLSPTAPGEFLHFVQLLSNTTW